MTRRWKHWQPRFLTGTPSEPLDVSMVEDGSRACRRLVRDALTNRFDAAIVITNDSDLVEPIRIAVQEAGKVVGLLSPVISGRDESGKWVAAHPGLTAVASFTLYIHNQHLQRAQFPQAIPGTLITRPSTWV